MGFDNRVANGELRVEVIWSSPSAEDVEKLRGFDSQIVQYVDRRSGEVLAHRDDEPPCADCATWRPRALGLR